ncbi:MAG: sulfurtransferase-like selenium metabolism protein YedF [Candidatus Sabulitectum sp.]|nr:sulfurtransferase-like selenium metabolism protein YedF [Candidatus Sabulitectum sp.]
MKEIDARGRPCPQPVLLAKEALKTGGSFSILVDGSGQAENIERAVKRAGAKSSIKNQDGFERVEVVPPVVVSRIESSSGKLVVSVPHETFGSGGDRELEEVLCRMYFHTLTEMDEGVPNTLVFYDSGVFLTSQKSPVLDDLEILEGNGVSILVCGTCLKHYGIVEKHAVGTISNMHEIAVELGSAERHYSI